MSRHLRRAALAAAAAIAALSASARGASDPSSDAPSASLPSSTTTAYRAAPGHLGLARAHPSLLSRHDLGALLTPEAFLIDATHALAGAALGAQPISGEDVRLLRRDGRAPALDAQASAGGGPGGAWVWRFGMALLDAEDGRFDPRPRLSAAGICYLAGLPVEGDQWVSEIPEGVRRENRKCLRMAVLAAALGGAPGAVAGSEGLVGWAAFEVMDLALWAKFVDGDMSFFVWRILSALLWRSVFADKSYKDYRKAMVAAGAPSKE